MGLHLTSKEHFEANLNELPATGIVTPILTFIDASHHSITAPAEWSEALIVINLPLKEWPNLRLERQGHAIEILQRKLGQEIRLTSAWPRSDPGRYHLKLFSKSENQPNQQLLESLVITVEPLKITSAARDELLEDLERNLPASIALSLANAGALEGVAFQLNSEGSGNTLAQELARLRSAVNGYGARPGLTSILRALIPDYHHILKTTEIWVREETARRPNLASLVPVLSRGSAYRREVDQPRNIPDTRVEHTPDTYENRLVKKYVWQVELALSQLIRSISRKTKLSENETAILQEAQLLHRNLLIVRRPAEAAFLSDVKMTEHLSVRPSMVVQRKPSYRSAYEGYLDFHRRPTVKLEEPRLESPLDNLPILYQVWATLKVVDILLKTAKECGYTLVSHNLLTKSQFDYYIQLLPDGKPVLEFVHLLSNTKIQLIPERKYIGRGGNQPGDNTKSFLQKGLHSVSYDQQPDIVVEVYPDGVTSPEVYLFDPKYKLESETLYSDDGDHYTYSFSPKPKKVDIDKMHAYRDAVRDVVGKRVVQYAAILYPGNFEEFGEGLAALPAYPGDEEKLLILEEALRKIFIKALSV